MIIYVGYVIADGASCALFVSADRKQVEEKLEELSPYCHPYIESYKIEGSELIELDCD